ncbi:MAG: hypothetical protein J6A19_05190 [Oscillospiraceae bacterium]|nr:hypothetical protein [Oscillospiraceae bacterium]
MGWNNAVITNSGLSLIAQAVSGGTLTITSAGLGGGTVDTTALMAQTALTTPLTVPAVISAKGTLDNGLTVRVQIRNTGVTAAQRMKQVGLFAKLSDNDPVLFAIMQDDIGEEIPPAAEYPDFMIEFTAAVAVSNTDNIVVTISSSAVITRGALDEELKNYTKASQFNEFSSTVSELSESKADKASVEEALNGKSDSGHTHDERYYTETETNELLDGKSNSGHTHDDRYYTEAETNNLLNGKADSTHTHSAATQSAAGFMSAADKTKLDGVAAGANAYTHPSYTARTGVPTANQTPAFGGTFQVTQPVSDASGHITGMNSRNVTIPATAASASAAGLVSTGAQTFAGNKTFNGQILPNGATAYGTPQARKLSSGTADVTTTNCPSGAWYGKHS